MTITEESEAMRKAYLDEFDISDKGGIDILNRAIEYFRRMREAEEIVNRDGLTVKNRFGELKEHPCLNTERKCRAGFLLALKQLNLDLIPANHRIGRPTK